MKNNIIYHNPKCSKSRASLALLEEKGINPEIIEYLKNPPSPEELAIIAEKLGLKPIQFIRTKEALFSELGLSASDQRTDKEWFEIMHKNPALIERPIIIHNDKAVIGRPPENILEII